MLIHADARALPFADRSFDTVLTSPPWDNLDVVAEVWPELNRVLTDDGLVAVLLPDRPNDAAVLRITDIYGGWPDEYRVPKPTLRVGPRYYSMSPLFVADWLEKLGAQRVLDPFAGVGTVPVAANNMGLYGVGCDIDRRALTAVAA